jgi:chromosomal replication initiation ATPase DnaA
VLSDISSERKENYYKLKDQRILGDAEFLEEIILQKESVNDTACFYEIDISEITQFVSAKWKIPLSEIRSEQRIRRGSFGRELVVYLTRKLTGQSMREIGEHLCKGESAIAKRYGVIEEKLRKDAALLKKVERTYRTLAQNRKRKL